MKNNIKPFIKRLIKDNIIYIFANIFLFFLIIALTKYSFDEISKYSDKADSLKQENIQLMNKVTLMNIATPTSEKLEENVRLLNSLIPNSEDYFTMIYALEKLSQKSNFIIINYDVNMASSSQEKIKISVTGVGDSQSFVNFLKDYNFSGGRLITSDKVQLDPNFSGSIKIDLTFYSKKTVAASKLETPPNKNIYEDLEAIKSKINFSFSDENPGNLEYPKKNNPF